MTQRLLSLAALATAFALPVAAFADTATLRYDDLDLATAAGQAQLATRIDTAAARACSQRPVTGSIIANARNQTRCIAAVRQQLSARFEGRAEIAAK